VLPIYSGVVPATGRYGFVVVESTWGQLDDSRTPLLTNALENGHHRDG